MTLSVVASAACSPAQDEAARRAAAFRCANGGPADVTRTLAVGRATQLDDNFNVGDAYRVEANPSGTISFGVGQSVFEGDRGSWGPDGKRSDLAPDGSSFPLPGQPKFALIGVFNQTPSHWFLLGSHSTCQVAVQAPSPPNFPGSVIFKANDDFSVSERGTWTVTVFEFHGSR